MESKDPHSVVLGRAELILKYLRGELNAAEEKQLNDWLQEDERNKVLLESLTEGTTLEECLSFLSSVDVPAALDRTLMRMRGQADQGSLPAPGLFQSPASFQRSAQEPPLPRPELSLKPGILARMGR